MTDDAFGQFVAPGACWDLAELQRELSGTIDDLDDAQRPYVPTNLSSALGMFLDSYGRPGFRWSYES